MVIQKNPEIIRQNFGVQLVHVMKFLSCCKLFFPRNGNRLVPLLIPSHEMEIRMKYEEFISMKLKPHSLY